VSRENNLKLKLFQGVFECNIVDYVEHLIKKISTEFFDEVRNPKSETDVFPLL
jgi:hypothetical protein